MEYVRNLNPEPLPGFGVLDEEILFAQVIVSTKDKVSFVLFRIKYHLLPVDFNKVLHIPNGVSMCLSKDSDLEKVEITLNKAFREKMLESYYTDSLEYSEYKKEAASAYRNFKLKNLEII